MLGNIFKKGLVLSPHTDDGELGAGATIARFLEEGVEFLYLAFSAPHEQLRDECIRSLNIIGVDEENVTILDIPRRYFPGNRQEILQTLYDLHEKENFDLVFTPSTRDLHQDHGVVTREALRIFKQSTILGYELPWNHIDFTENCFVAIEESHLNKKLDALSQYESQHKHHYFSPQYVRSLAITRGGQIATPYAESYELIKLVLFAEDRNV